MYEIHKIMEQVEENEINISDMVYINIEKGELHSLLYLYTKEYQIGRAHV